MIFSGAALAQTPAPTASATASDVAALRDQVQALTETVKQLQQQVKDQQTLLEKANLAGNQPQAEVAASPSASPSPGENAPFPTTDTSVVAAAPTPGVSANGTSAAGGFPTTDESVVASTSTATTTAENPPITAATSSLTQPITIGGGKTYMNISLDSVFALAYSSAANLHDIEVGDHDPQQRGFNARNTELAFDGAVDPYFEGFANIVFLLDNDNQTEVELEEAFMQTTSLPYNSAIKRRTIFRRLRPAEPDASAHLGLRGHASRQRLIFRARRVARCWSASFLDIASTVVFAVDLCVAKRTREHRIFVPESR